MGVSDIMPHPRRNRNPRPQPIVRQLRRQRPANDPVDPQIAQPDPAHPPVIANPPPPANPPAPVDPPAPAPEMDRNLNVGALNVAQPLPLSDDQLGIVADRVSAQVVAQMSQQREQIPIFDVNQGNTVLNLLSTTENDRCLLDSVNYELGFHVPNNLKLKIVNGEYIDLGKLLVKNVDPDDDEKQFTFKDGNLVLENKKSTVTINSIYQWTDAFIIFAGIYLTAYPSTANALLKYMHTIRLGANRSSGIGWKNYDMQFRMKKAKNPALSWSIVDQELWLFCMNQSSTPVVGYTKPQTTKRCYDYNYKGVCTKNTCAYQHRCLRCNYTHPLIKCRVPTANIPSLNYRGNQTYSARPSNAPSATISRNNESRR